MRIVPASVYLVMAHVWPGGWFCGWQKDRLQRRLWICINLIKCNILFQLCIIDSSPVQHCFCPQSQVMCGETCWARTMILSQNDCPFGRQQAAADVPRVLVTFGKRAHKQTVSHGSSSGVNTDNRAQSRRRCAATWRIVRVCIKQMRSAPRRQEL